MSTHAEILAAIKAHRRAVAEYAQADEPRQMAAWGLMKVWPQDRQGALAFFGYLATLEDELEPGLAQMAAVILDRLRNTKPSRLKVGPGQAGMIRFGH
jgi:hypothetical protein